MGTPWGLAMVGFAAISGRPSWLVLVPGCAISGHIGQWSVGLRHARGKFAGDPAKLATYAHYDARGCEVARGALAIKLYRPSEEPFRRLVLIVMVRAGLVLDWQGARHLR